MIRTLKITSVITAIGAVILLILPAVYGVRSDPAIEELLKAPDAVEKFIATKGQTPSGSEGQSSPLINQALKFSTYLNPPPPVAPIPPPSPTDIQEAAPMAPVTAKFDLRGTSYYAVHPELSLALIDEPGKGLYWVRQGSTVGHLVIEEVKDGVVIVKDGQRKSEMKVEIKEAWRELLKSPSGGTKPVGAVQPAKPGPADAGRISIKEAKTGAGAAPPSRSPIRATGSRRTKPGTEGALPGAPGTSTTTSPGGPQPAMGGAVSSEQRPGSGPATSPQIVELKPAATDQTPAQGAPEQQPTAAESENIPPPQLPTEKDIIHLRLMEEVKASRITEEEARQMEEAAQTIE